MTMQQRLALSFLFFAFAFAASAADAPKPLAAFRDCPECPEMVWLPSGTFIMGSTAQKEEMPAHRVTFPKPFAIGKYEVTFDEWDACLKAGGCTHNPDDHKWGRGRRPAINVTHDQAKGFAAWLATRTGATYRLPSEAEWEYAARAGTTTEYFWGDEAGQNRANCRDCESEWSKLGSGPVGSFPANPWGLHDLHGNVWEWNEDCWNPSYAGAPADGAARLTGNCGRRVMRGGSWYYFSRNSRSAWRFSNDPRVPSYGIGFRVVREAK